MAENGPVWDPLSDPKNPPKKVYVGLFLASFPRKNEAHKLFSGGQNLGFWVGAKKFMSRKFMCFFGPLKSWKNKHYTLARKYYIHKVLFSELIPPPPNYISVTRKQFSGINFPKATYHVFACDSENYMENRLGILFLKNLISVT